MAVFAPIPNASDSTAMAENSGLASSIRMAYRTSRRNCSPIIAPPPDLFVGLFGGNNFDLNRLLGAGIELHRFSTALIGLAKLGVRMGARWDVFPRDDAVFARLQSFESRPALFIAGAALDGRERTVL